MKRWKEEKKKKDGEHLKRDDDESEGMTTNGMEGGHNNSRNGY